MSSEQEKHAKIRMCRLAYIGFKAELSGTTKIITSHLLFDEPQLSVVERGELKTKLDDFVGDMKSDIEIFNDYCVPDTDYGEKEYKSLKRMSGLVEKDIRLIE